MNRLINIKFFYFLIFLLSIFTIISAIYIEYVIGAKPCKLCLYQRIPYLFAIFVSFLGYYNNKRIIWVYVLLFIFLISFILSLYHVGIEQSIFPEFSGCVADTSNITDKQKLLESLNETPPNCKDVNFKIIGLSLATINVLISFGIVFFSFILIKNEKN